MDKRNRFEIVADILMTLESRGALYKTQIANKCNLDTRMLNRYMEMLLDAGLITQAPDTPRAFIITDEGRRYLMLYNRIRQMLSDYEFNLH
ncbi:MAG: winged helix-turn-helix domain-containing protein [Candidatus Nitrosocaldus sp.]|nr:winged helix-turn-helix domain-containing protein [Candidatus Nitrosocaldus sp.]MCS7140867.1 winged helix-turn-helix domain-containing protein [Candidatus Nitrosocaldus sp.]MDW7999795.1 winged helix-turn-helix domain-containing protein [Candidatus Nitrosocaldus sp.]MDW8274844.1 winged helix-turn-helix domain-containing protein [Candidatus Nitrosocaldus sp.]